MRLADQDAAGIPLCEQYAVADVDSHIIEPADLPFLGEAMDWQWLNVGAHKEFPERLLPSEYMRRQIFGMYWFDRESLRAVIDLLADNLMFETDFPHATGLSPGPASESPSPREVCDACYSTHLLGHWVRKRKAITLEDAVWRLTGQPARAFRIAGRGLVREGHFADLVAFDPAAIGTTPIQRVHDQPGGADRLIVRSTGVEHMWVNGVAARSAGEDIPGVAAGRVLRS